MDETYTLEEIKNLIEAGVTQQEKKPVSRG